eukprot:3119849-Rhodomonas_salina.1
MITVPHRHCHTRHHDVDCAGGGAIPALHDVARYGRAPGQQGPPGKCRLFPCSVKLGVRALMVAVPVTGAGAANLAAPLCLLRHCGQFASREATPDLAHCARSGPR